MIKDTNKGALNNLEADFLSSFIKKTDSLSIWKASVKDINIKEFSENILKITGYSSKDILNISDGFYALIHPDDLLKIKKSYKRFINNPGEEELSVIYRIINKDQNIVWIKEEIRGQKDITGKIESYIGVIQNISEFKKAESTLLTDNEKLLQLNKSKDKFLSILSHDLRAPFTSILGFTEILMNEPDLTINEKNEYLNYIHESAQNQLQLINYLLDWTRLQTGRMKIEPERIHAQTLVFNCIASLTGNAIRKNIDIKASLPDNLFIQADERLITQVVTNLLSNAIKYSRENKHIEISAEIFNDEKVEFIVKDQGIGILDIYKEKLFRVDKKFSTEGTKGEKGTGLGLSLVKEIVEKHNGDIWFYTEVDAGSEFHFTLPSSQNSILLVEDNPEDKLFLEKIISENFPEFKLIVTDNGYEAITIMTSKIPSLIVTKHDIPFMDGIQLLKSIRKGEKGYKVPVIAIIPDVPEETIKLYHEYGINALLQKPIDIKKFKENLYSALN
ncbi:MAG: ATP-binding protein [Ignavibacteriaceae bacterium]|nr:ATP-binding protein [Ignavibacteriaceae bacterium]